MNTHSHVLQTLPQGVVLDVTIEDLTFKAYVVVSEPDINKVADFVPREQFEQGGDLHVAAIERAGDAREQIEDITFNMNLNDVAVFLCSDEPAYDAALEELGQNNPEHVN